jgi:hypothetical protein
LLSELSTSNQIQKYAVRSPLIVSLIPKTPETVAGPASAASGIQKSPAGGAPGQVQASSRRESRQGTTRAAGLGVPFAQQSGKRGT